MKAEFVARLNAEQCQRAYSAYNQLAIIYEDICGGPYGAREFKEYFAIMDSRDYLRRRYNELILCNDGTDK